MSSHAEPQDIARRSADALWAEDLASRHLGMEILAVSPGRAQLAMTVGETMVNGLGTCHGGLIFTLADSAFGYACNAYGQRTTAQHCAISFIAPGKLGMRLIATAEERHRGDRSGIYDVTVRDESGAVIAELRGYARTVAGSLLHPQPTEEQEITR